MMDRLSTGDAGLDRVLQGGFPTGSLIVVAGSPGTGKTILAQQLCFANATDDARALYYTTLSEPHSKMIQHMSSFGFFDRAGLGSKVDLLNLTGIYASREEDGGLQAAFTEVVTRCFDQEPAVVVIDSAKALREYDEPHFRQAVYELASAVSHSNAVLVFVGEYTPEDIEQGPEFAVADGVIQLTNEDRGPINRRALRVRKMRGTSFLPGRHSLDITDKGVNVFPRLESIGVQPSAATQGREATGIAELDEIMHGGPRRGDATLLLGPSGVGKTTLALQSLLGPINNGERCLYFSFQESLAQLRNRAAGISGELVTAIDNGTLVIRHIPPVEIDLDRFGVALQEELSANPVRRVVVDSLAELAYAIRETERLPGYVFTMLSSIAAAGGSSLLTSETDFFGPSNDIASGLMVLFQNVVSLRYVEVDSDVLRAIGIINMRNSGHSRDLIEFSVGEEGITTNGHMHGVTGSMGWSVLRAESGKL